MFNVNFFLHFKSKTDFELLLLCGFLQCKIGDSKWVDFAYCSCPCQVKGLSLDIKHYKGKESFCLEPYSGIDWLTLTTVVNYLEMSDVMLSQFLVDENI